MPSFSFVDGKWWSYIKDMKKNWLDIETKNTTIQWVLLWSKLDIHEVKTDEVEYKPKKSIHSKIQEVEDRSEGGRMKQKGV